MDLAELQRPDTTVRLLPSKAGATPATLFPQYSLKR
jgi:hypothetical protein